MNSTVDAAWASPGSEGVIVQLPRGAGESPKVLHHVTIARIGKRDLVATDTSGGEHRFKVAGIDEYGFRSAVSRSAWSPTVVLADPASAIVAVSKASDAASREYVALAGLVDKLRNERTPEIAGEVAQAAMWLAATLRVVENLSKKENR